MNVDLLKCLKEYKVDNVPIINDPDSKLNKLVKQIYVINMKEDIHKRNYIRVLLQKYKINYNLIIVDRVDQLVYNKLCKTEHISTAELGCCLSHMWCLTDILKNNFENAIIFEDDVILSKHFVDDFSKIYEKHPKTDLLLLGSHDFNFSRQHFKNVKNALYRPDSDVTKLYGAHANYYSLNGAKRMFYIRATNLSFFDNEYNLIFNSLPNSYICYPNLAIANMTESKLNHEKNILSQNEINYYTECFINLKLNTYNLIYTNLLDLALLKADDTVEAFIERCLFQIFNDDNKIKIIKMRFVFNFFTINDLKNMLSNQDLSVMVPNNLSKKCIGELL